MEILLNYARLDQSLISLNKSTVRLEPMLQQILTDKVEDHIKVALNLEGSSEASISADSNYLSMLFKNLIQNAKQHCKSQLAAALKEYEKICSEYESTKERLKKVGRRAKDAEDRIQELEKALGGKSLEVEELTVKVEKMKDTERSLKAKAFDDDAKIKSLEAEKNQFQEVARVAVANLENQKASENTVGGDDETY